MNGIQYLTIGYIPSDCNSERIICGDPDGSGTKESSLKIEGNKITSIDTNQTIEVDPGEFFNEKSKLWKQVVKNFCSDFVEKELKPNMIGACWAIFIDEISGKKGITKLADEDDGGEFHNRGGCNNGKFYVRYQLEEDDEYFGERVLSFD
jgi:hypothetical protein